MITLLLPCCVRSEYTDEYVKTSERETQHSYYDYLKNGLVAWSERNSFIVFEGKDADVASNIDIKRLACLSLLVGSHFPHIGAVVFGYGRAVVGVVLLASVPFHQFAGFALWGLIWNQTIVTLSCSRWHVVVFNAILQHFALALRRSLFRILLMRGSVVIVPPRLVLRVAVPKLQYPPIHTTVLGPSDLLDASSPIHTPPAIVPQSLLRKIR